MRRVVGGLAVALVVVVAVPVTAQADAGGVQRATGNGTISLGSSVIDVRVGVVGGQAGGQGTVQFSVEGTTLQETMAASCLSVNGTLATIRATVTQSSGSPPQGTELIVFVQDNGKPGSSPPDKIGVFGADPYPLQGCDFPPTSDDAGSLRSLTTGNLVVVSGL